MRIAILAHSTNPRGGVVHALAVADALTCLGHQAAVHAPDAHGTGFFRPTLCKTICVSTTHSGPATHDLVTTRIADYVRHFKNPAHRRFDVFHAQDGISGNALATLKERGLIPAFARTVHHVDDFADPRLAALQTRSILCADQHFVVSRLGLAVLHDAFGLIADNVGNGVDRAAFSRKPTDRDAALRQSLGLGTGPVYLAVGGIEARKNTLNILRAFTQVLALHPDARLVIAGGASLLDHSAYQRAFHAEMVRIGDAATRVIVTGRVDQNDMPALYRIADAVVFPSVKEGFGLVALEAIACGTPVVTSRIPPFTELFADKDVIWCSPDNAASIADAMVLALQPAFHARPRRIEALLARHDWQRTAAAHLPAYEKLREVEHA